MLFQRHRDRLWFFFDQITEVELHRLPLRLLEGRMRGLLRSEKADLLEIKSYMQKEYGDYLADDRTVGQHLNELRSNMSYNLQVLYYGVALRKEVKL